MFDDFKQTPKTMENLSELANKVYDDCLKKPVQATGEVIAILPQAIKAALEPVEQWILYKKHSLAITEKMLEEKLKDVNPEEIVPPEPYVAVPALNAIACCYDSNELRNLYANLIARSMLKKEKDNVHPAFVEIIKQLSPTDAVILKILFEKFRLSVPLVHANLLHSKQGDYIKIIKNICNVSPYDYSVTAISIENLHRLKIIDITTNERFTNDAEYDKIINSPKLDFFLRLRVIMGPDDRFDFKRVAMQPTSFGLSFCETCIKDL